MASHPHLPLPDYFSKFASNYVRQTGNSTLDILGDVISEHVQTSAHPIDAKSVVHDNAAGPGIGAAALVARLPKEQLPQELLVSDNVPEMVSAARHSLTASPLQGVECKVLDSQDLKSAGVADDYFTHSIINFSIFTFERPVDAIRETYRTLRPGGLAVVSCWQRFPPVILVHAAQKRIRADLPLMTSPGSEFFKEGELQRVVEEGGFKKENITMAKKTLVVADEGNIAELTMLITGPMMAKAREGYTAGEEARWAESIRQAVKEEVEQFGGIKFEAYILLATK